MEDKDLFSFGIALHMMQNGHAVARKGWNGKGLSTRIQRPDENSKMTKPYFYITHNSGADGEKDGNVPWLPSQTDLLGEDWYLTHFNSNEKTS